MTEKKRIAIGFVNIDSFVETRADITRLRVARGAAKCVFKMYVL
jgi:hypothetical protein